jgi:FMN phosphatase YigB (HAD superfamily)
MSAPHIVLPHQLATALDGRRGIRMLSLDCFDTLLWRDVHAPADLFAVLEGVTTDQRQKAEATARKARVLAHHASGEVTLREIYAALLPDATEAEREAFVVREIDAEARHCHAFGPTVELMRAAKRRGLPIAIVSDTYLERDQLADLIRRAAGDEVADMIDYIFCSCEHRQAKNEGLFGVLLRATGMRADRILHVGDNPQADAAAGTRHGLATLHLVQFDEATQHRLRQERTVGAMMMPAVPGFQTHRAAMAIGTPQLDDPATVLGYGVLGPVLSTFADWLATEADAVQATRGGQVHLLFLMRDGYLPRETFAALMPDRPTHAVEISRFTAIAASLGGPGAIERFVTREIGDGAGRNFLRQLLIEGHEADTILAALPATRAAHALADVVRSERWSQTIAARGNAMADRLIDYLDATVKPATGDTLMLVDLGYSGTVQDHVAPLLEQRLGVHIAGRYLLWSEDMPSGHDKRGLIDQRAHDPAALAAIMSAVAVLEQLCTVAQGSVVDYAGGEPVRAEAGIKGRQSEVRATVQAGCVRYARDHAAARVRPTNAFGAEADRRSAVATLARFLYLPSPQELALLARFEHDCNLGSDEMVALFDPEHAATGLRERGMFYMKKSQRMFLPAELRGKGLPTSLTLLAQRRFGLDLRYPDFCDHSVEVPLLIADGQKAFIDTVAATPTHDGYYVAAIPVGYGQYTIGLQFGRRYEWLQIQSARFLPVTAFLTGEADHARSVVPAMPSCEGMEQVAPHMFRCDGPEAFLMVPPPEGAADEPMMLAVVFRPLVEREPDAAIAAAPATHSSAAA